MSIETTTVVRAHEGARAILERHNNPRAVRPAASNFRRRAKSAAVIMIISMVAYFALFLVNFVAEKAFDYVELSGVVPHAVVQCSGGDEMTMTIQEADDYPLSVGCSSSYYYGNEAYTFSDYRLGDYNAGEPSNMWHDGALVWMPPLDLFFAIWIVGGIAFALRQQLWYLAMRGSDWFASYMYDAAVRRNLIRVIHVPIMYRQLWLDATSVRHEDMRRAGIAQRELTAYDAVLADRADLISHQMNFLEGIADPRTDANLRIALEMRVRSELNTVVDAMIAEKTASTEDRPASEHNAALQHLLINTPAYRA